MLLHKGTRTKDFSDREFGSIAQDDVTWDEWDTEPTGDASESDASDAPLQSFSAAIVIANHSLVDDIG